MYKVEVLEYLPKAKKMAEAIEKKINEMNAEGYDLVTLTETTSARSILVFKK